MMIGVSEILLVLTIIISLIFLILILRLFLN
mgnify:CR=1 FL=1|jgi:hypothetical protein